LLLLPLALVIGFVILASRLSDDSDGLLVGSAACPGEGCESAVYVTVECTFGSACTPSPDESNFVSEAAPPPITARAAAIIEEPCGALLYGDSAHQRLAPASLTKIATALVASERADLSEIVDVRVDGAELALTTDSTVMGLEPGQQLSLRDLLYGLLLPSGNDAALAIAEHVSFTTTAFVDLMNDKVEQLGLSDTNFTNPHGLDEVGLYTSAFDIAMLGRELIRKPELATIVRTTTYQPAWDGPPLWNGNRLVYSYPDSLGVKIGYTDEAQQTIVAAADRGGRRLIVSALGSSSIYDDAVALLDWAFASSESVCGESGVGTLGGQTMELNEVRPDLGP
jgi:D-alanyl-D-alanine carboxypeptidase (penicillin-binding protein 5/6)